jgi:hypothetical protein
MLVELRALEKAHDLDTLVASHLAGAGEVRFDLEAFRYMLREGRIALLFDGFDELALRVSYRRAAEHLATLLGAVQGQAKVVLTSRSQYFLTDDDVLKALGQRVEMIPGRRLARLENFTDAQIRRFLRQRYRPHSTGGHSGAKAAEAGVEDLVDRRMALIRDIHDLLGLATKHRIGEVAFSSRAA